MIDFLVIGGGIAGLSAGARLSSLGKVTVLESETALGYHASGRSAALFEQNYGKPSVVALNKASRDYLATAHGGVLTPRGLMLVGTADLAELYKQDQTEMDLDELTMPEAVALCPILRNGVVDRVAYSPAAFDIDTDRLLQNFARDIRQSGGTILTGAAVTKIAKSGTGWQVETKKGGFEAAVIVNAAGAWVDQIAVLAGLAPIGFTPLRRSMARIPAPSDPAAWPMVFGAGEDWYFKPDAGALIVSPAEEDATTPHDAYVDDMVLAEGLARFEAHTTVEVTRLLSSWAGLRTFSPDRQLVIGPDPRDPSFVWSAGQGGYGFQTSAAASQLVADLVAGRAPEIGTDIAAMLTPARFV